LKYWHLLCHHEAFRSSRQARQLADHAHMSVVVQEHTQSLAFAFAFGNYEAVIA